MEINTTAGVGGQLERRWINSKYLRGHSDRATEVKTGRGDGDVAGLRRDEIIKICWRKNVKWKYLSAADVSFVGDVSIVTFQTEQ